MQDSSRFWQIKRKSHRFYIGCK